MKRMTLVSKDCLNKTLKVMQWFVDNHRSVDPSEIKRWIESITIETVNSGHRNGQSETNKDLVSSYCRCGYRNSNCIPVGGGLYR